MHEQLISHAVALLLLTLCAPFGAGCGASDPAMTTLSTLSGTYSDPTSYDYGGAYGRRVFTFDDGRWTLEFVLALDPALTQRVFAFRTLGEYRVLGPSDTVPGAYDTVFTEEAKFVTLLTESPQLTEAFGLSACNLVPGQERDVSVTGCAIWRPVAVCGEDHDLLSLTGDGGVRFGVRPRDNDMCTPARRPTTLTPPVQPTSAPR